MCFIPLESFLVVSTALKAPLSFLTTFRRCLFVQFPSLLSVLGNGLSALIHHGEAAHCICIANRHSLLVPFNGFAVMPKAEGPRLCS